MLIDGKTVLTLALNKLNLTECANLQTPDPDHELVINLKKIIDLLKYKQVNINENQITSRFGAS